MFCLSSDSPDAAAPPKGDDAPGAAAAPKPGDPNWAGLPNPPGVEGAPNAAPGVDGVPKAAPGVAGVPKALPGAPKPAPADPNAFPGAEVGATPNAAVGVDGVPNPTWNTLEHAENKCLALLAGFRITAVPGSTASARSCWKVREWISPLCVCSLLTHATVDIVDNGRPAYSLHTHHGDGQQRFLH